MKRITTLLTAVLLACTLLNAQQYDVLDQLKADIRKSYGMEGPHRLDESGPICPAPSGYKPFYISHYGRHGSRYAWNSDTYLLLHQVFSKASQLGVLTPYGKEFAARYEAFWMEPWINSGDLVPLGFDQHLALGEFVYTSFPQVFKGRKRVDALSSTSQRAVVSMSAFNLGLKSCNPKLTIRLRSDHTGMTVAAPQSAHKSLVRHFKGENDRPEGWETQEEFFVRTTNYQPILDRLFTDCSFFSEFQGGALYFLRELWQLLSGYHNYEPRPLFDDLLTQEERLKLWESDNYFSFRGDITARYKEIPLLQDIMEKAESAFDDPNEAANLRFGHDYILEALITLINVNGCGTIPATPEEVKYWFRNFDMPMAATLLFVFYKNKQGDILFKPVLNEKDAFLPQLTLVSGNFYRWGDFRAWADDLFREHPQIQE